MCGRYALHSHPDVVALHLGLSSIPEFEPRYNIAPTSKILIAKSDGAAMVRWGLGGKFPNLRAETVTGKPHGNAYRRRRCLIPASGFYEWLRTGSVKQPYYVRPAQAELFAFAGLWETWRELETCAIITTEANEAMRAIHDRMPVILAPQDYAKWLAGDAGLLRPCPAGAIRAYGVSAAVNRAANDSAELIEPLHSNP